MSLKFDVTPYNWLQPWRQLIRKLWGLQLYNKCPKLASKIIFINITVLSFAFTLSAFFWVISNNHDAARTKFWIGHQLTLGSASDPRQNCCSQFGNQFRLKMQLFWIAKLKVTMFWGVQSTSNSKFLADSKLGGGSIMILLNDPKSCTTIVNIIWDSKTIHSIQSLLVNSSYVRLT